MTKTILVTGASAGFGAAIVERFAGAGWRVVATGRRVDRLQQLVERFGADVVHPAAFDIRDADAMQAALDAIPAPFRDIDVRSEEHTSELQSLMRISYAVSCLKKKNHKNHRN